MPGCRITAVVALCGLLPVLLGRMRTELLREGRLSGPTATAMYEAYAAQAAAILAAARRRHLPFPGPGSLSTVGTAVGGVGLASTVGGMRRFSRPAQLTGTDAGDLLTGGVYRWSRNPQYTGLVTVLLGLGLARRSGGVLLMAVGTAGVYGWWVRVEEAALSARFGAAYDTYRERTARCVGPPRRS